MTGQANGPVQFNTEGLSISVVPANAISEDEWRDLQFLHMTSVAAQPGVDDGRAKQIASWDTPIAYRAVRQSPRKLVESGDWNEAVFDKVSVARLFDYETPVSVTVMHDTASPRLPIFQRAEMWAKMHMPQALPVPLVGRRRYAHAREIYSHPDIDAELALVGLWHSLAKRHPKQNMSMYTTPLDPSDSEMTAVAQKLELTETGCQNKRVNGYISDTIVRHERAVYLVMASIMERPELSRAMIQIPWHDA
jgi:hypothetical protein